MLTLAQAQTILQTALGHAESNGFKPLAIAVLDARGAQKAFAAQDGTSLKRGEIALGKANGAVALGVGPRTLNKMALERPHFINGATLAIGGSPGATGLTASGMFVINPPHTLASTLRSALPRLEDALARGPHAGWSVDAGG